jgi:hypothetical protein
MREVVMPRESIECERCSAPASYVRTQIHDLEHSAGKTDHVGSVPLVKGGDLHVYKCSKCGHLTRVLVPD